MSPISLTHPFSNHLTTQILYCNALPQQYEIGPKNFRTSQNTWEEKGMWSMPQARKRHININLFVRLVLGFTGFVPGTNPVCPWDKSGENLGQTQFFSLFYTVEARFHRVCPWDKPGLSLGQSRGRKEAQKVYVKNIYVPFSLANATRMIAACGTASLASIITH